ncbi:hypothetical protein HDF16_005631 [Granulicella aggregans]|uniref:Uncharacterized protein n=1 Tax=Granulicella aggregans TaxID=474949 RepID=A0A7W7ZJ68_9BACT|nr:hypothetical protein [Granulicella aggregans]
MESEENIKPFPSLPTVLGNRKCSDFTHSHRTDYYELFKGPILTFSQQPKQLILRRRSRPASATR